MHVEVASPRSNAQSGRKYRVCGSWTRTGQNAIRDRSHPPRPCGAILSVLLWHRAMGTIPEHLVTRQELSVDGIAIACGWTAIHTPWISTSRSVVESSSASCQANCLPQGSQATHSLARQNQQAKGLYSRASHGPVWQALGMMCSHSPWV